MSQQVSKRIQQGRADMTCNFGHQIKATFNDLKARLGEPAYQDMDKSKVEWSLLLDGDFVFTIYDYKECDDLRDYPDTIYTLQVGSQCEEHSDLAIAFLESLGFETPKDENGITVVVNREWLMSF